MAILEATFRADTGLEATEKTLTRLVQLLARDIGARALPYARAVLLRCPELAETIVRLEGR